LRGPRFRWEAKTRKGIGEYKKRGGDVKLAGVSPGTKIFRRVLERSSIWYGVVSTTIRWGAGEGEIQGEKLPRGNQIREIPFLNLGNT